MILRKIVCLKNSEVFVKSVPSVVEKLAPFAMLRNL